MDGDMTDDDSSSSQPISSVNLWSQRDYKFQPVYLR